MNTHLSLVERIHSYIATYNLLPKQTRIVLGLSGGPDSVFLLNLLAPLHAEQKIHMIAAHLDHGWRSTSSDDAAFCQRICTQYEVPCVIGHAREYASVISKTGSLEDRGRRLRHAFFDQVRQDHNASHVALGHHADDQYETFFIRLLRGSSLTGLTGMKPHQGVYIRPLLCVRKHEIVSYLNAHNITYSVDPTNSSEQFLRSRLRTTVIPALEQVDTRMPITFTRTLEHLQATEQFLEQYAAIMFAQSTTKVEGNVALDTKKFALLDPVIQHRVLLRWFSTHTVPFPVHEGFFNEVIRFLISQRGGAHHVHTTWRIVKKAYKAHIAYN